MKQLRACPMLGMSLLAGAILLPWCAVASQDRQATVSTWHGEPQQYDDVDTCWNDAATLFKNSCERRCPRLLMDGSTMGDLRETTRFREEHSGELRDSEHAHGGHAPAANNAAEFAAPADTRQSFFDFGTDTGDIEFDLDAFIEQAKNIVESKIPGVKKTSDEIDFKLSERVDNGDDYVYPGLMRLNAGKVGEAVDVGVGDGEYIRRVTLSTRPAVFEFPDFLSSEECDYVIEMAKAAGLNRSSVKGFDLNEQFADGRNTSEISRVSETAKFRRNTNISPDFLNKIHRRISKLTELPLGVIERSENIQVARYTAGGHYHAHLDSEYIHTRLPCCFQTQVNSTLDEPGTCRICRVATFLYYLNDVQEGGETAFPLAGLSLTQLQETMQQNTGKMASWINLSHNCHAAPLVVRPRKGKAILWYNHYLDATGYLGQIDARTHHGGCDVIQGTKWIATNWILAPTYKERFKGSRNFVKPTAQPVEDPVAA